MLGGPQHSLEVATVQEDGHSQLGLAIARSSLERRGKLEEVATMAAVASLFGRATEALFLGAGDRRK
jgi:hypothetical protein